MMIMTAKVDMKKIMTILAAIAALIIAIVMLFGGEDTAATAAPAVSHNEGRVQFLKDLGWDVTTAPVESTQVKIPQETSDVFRRYNALQQSQGYDLTKYAGKTVMRHVYQVNNYPGATEPVYATVLVHRNQVIGGDITDTAAKGKIQPLKNPEIPTQPSETIPGATQ